MLKLQTRSAALPQLQTRTAAKWRPTTFDDKRRSVRAVAATEAKIKVFDAERWEVIDEVLLMSGVLLPASRQAPLLDCHNRSSVCNVLGSARDFKPIGAELECEVFFSDDTSGRDAAVKVRDGHLDSFSVGYRIISAVWIPENEKQVVEGRAFEGPCRVVSSWELKELSITPLAADGAATVRTNCGGANKMNEEEIRLKERQRVAEITALCTRFNCPEIGARLVADGATEDLARSTVLAFLQRSNLDPVVPSFRPTIIEPYGHVDEADKRSAAMIDGLTMRAGFTPDRPALGAEDFRGITLVDVARECLAMQNKRVRGMSPNAIVREALSTRAATTSDFPYILAAVSGKVLRKAYELAPGTFQAWTVQTDGTDFKEMSRVQISEAPDLLEVPENVEYKLGTFGESREVFKIYTYGRLFGISRQAIINDDLQAFVRIPRAFAASGKRGVNSAVYGVLIANAAMGDNVALFHGDHSNYVAPGAGAAPGITTLTAARLAMRTQTGLAGVVLNITPRFLLSPAALETGCDAFLNTMEGQEADEGPGQRNPFYRKLELVVDPCLDADSAAAWYLAGDPAQVDTVEICYLDGKREPYLETKDGWNVDGMELKVRFDYGVKALDWRGLYKNSGE